MIRNSFRYILKVLCGVACMSALSSCTDEYGLLYREGKPSLNFTAEIENDRSTRASTPINSDYANVKFYVMMDYKPQNDQPYMAWDKIGNYVVKSGYTGIFDVATASQTKLDSLNWQTADTDHMFVGWSFTQGTKANDPVPKVKNDAGETITYVPSRDTQTIYFNNEFYPDNWGDWQNGALFEKFVGAVNGPYNYESNGAYAPLHFYHLVSKISVQVRVYDYSGYYTDIPYTMTINGLPSRGTFYPYSQNDDGTPKLPYVEKVEKDDDAVTFKMIGRNNSTRYPFYICPDVDISQLSYTIKVGDGSIATNGVTWEQMFPNSYKGDFSKLKNFTNRKNPGEQSTILHAGEYLQIVLWLMPDGGTGAGVTIVDWNVMDEQEGTTYPRTGIFSSGEANELTGSNVDWDDIFGRYGDTSTGEKVINVYDNVEITDNTLTVPDPYVLDGLGHLFTLPEDTTDITLQNVRNAYFTNGTKIIYIDDEGNIYSVDPLTFEMTPAGQMNDSGSTTIPF